MKKIFSFFFAALVSAGMFADTHYIAGSFTDWNNNKVAMTPIDGTTCSIVTIDIQTGAWEAFKVVDGSNWLGQSNASANIENTRLKYSLDGGENLNLNAATQGDYTFIYNYDTNGDESYVKTVSVLYPNTMFVAAGAEGLFGSNWSGTDENNKLTEGENYVYSLVKENVTLAAGTYTFKVVANNDWDNASFPAQNKEIVIDKSGKYDVTITFNLLSQAVTAEAELIEEEVVLPTIALSGSWGENGDFEDLVLTTDEGNLTASATKSFAAVALGTYEFGVKVNGNWTSNGSEVTFSRTNHSVLLTGYSGNMHMMVDVVEPLTFTWEYASNTLTITYPVLPEKPVIGCYATWNGHDFSTQILTEDEGGETASYSRNLVANGTYLFRMVKNGTLITINGEGTSRYEFHSGWKSAVIDGSGDRDMLLTTDAAGRYTFKWEYASNTLTITFPGTATGINGEGNGEWRKDEWTKVLENGVLYLKHGETTYTIDGRVVR